MRTEFWTAVLVFLAALASVGIPALSAVAGVRKARALPFFWVPIALVLQFLFLSLFAAALHGVIPFGWTKLLLCGTAAFVGSWLGLRALCARLSPRRFPFANGRMLLALVALTVTLFSDVGYLMLRQGWGLDSGLTHSNAYFRPPFNSDAQRNVALARALLRGDESPYLPGSRLSYPTFWHHFTTLFLWKVPTGFSFAALSGCALATGFLLAFLALWLFLLWRPALALGDRLSPFLVLLLFTHADIFHFLGSWIENGVPGIEADWSYSSAFFRYFSFKLLVLTSPQHAAFFLPALVYLALGQSSRSRVGRGLFVTGAVFVSPILSAFFFPPLWISRQIRRPLKMSELIALGIALAVAVGLHYLIFRLPIWELFQKNGAGQGRWLAPALGWWILPLWIFACGGTAGVLGFLLAFRRGKHWLPNEIVAASLVGGLCFYYAFTDIEIRRHFSMVLAVWLPLGVWKAMPRRKALALSPRAASAIGLGALAAATLHGYFLYSYAGKPSVLDPKIPWHDYFAMNRRIGRELEGVPVLAATTPDTGFVKPVALEVTTSFADGLSARVHGKVPPAAQQALDRAERGGEVLPFGLALGYRAVLWGAVEERVWGAKGRERFLTGAKLAEERSVSLYRLTDALALAPSESPLDHADRLLKRGWFFEAGEIFRDRIASGEESARARFGLGVVAARTGRLLIAENEIRRAVELEPGSVPYRLALSHLYQRLSMFEEAREQIQEAILLDPRDSSIKGELRRLADAEAGTVRN